MTEAEWLEATSSLEFLDFYSQNTEKRKLRLFALAICRQHWRYIKHQELRDLIQLGERFVEKEVSQDQLDEASRAITDLSNEHYEEDATFYFEFALHEYLDVGEIIDRSATLPFEPVAPGAEKSRAWLEKGQLAAAALQREQVRFLHDIFGNPFRPVTLKPGWRTTNVVNLAHALYHERELPSGLLNINLFMVLADALEEAGCTDEAILSHCGGPGPHVRGCWVVDLLLGKE